MPTYEYKCRTCGHTFEKFQNITDKPVSKCPNCGHKVKRLIGAGSGIIFKDSGTSSVKSNVNSPSCGRDAPCCGRDIPCNSKSCE